MDPLTAVIVAGGLVAGVPWIPVGLLLLGARAPAVGIAVVLVLVTVCRRESNRPTAPDAESVLLAAISAELRAGASLRSALESAVGRAPDVLTSPVARLARSGAPIEHVALALAQAVPRLGRVVAPALEITAQSGGLAASVFDRLAERSATLVELDRERVALTAQARLSAGIVGGLPVVILVTLGVSGRISGILESGRAGAAAVVAGATLLILGGLVVWSMTRRMAAP